ncbi:MAG: AtpZ/AtpI family protein [Bacteroidetes bacterium]|nr:AtpZ/AtpI family protein [Bacteroidota bacterium]
MPPQKQPNQLIKYSNLGIQMAAIIGISAWGGTKLDEYYKNQTAVFTIVLSLLGIAVALYIVLKGLIKPDK